MVIPSMTVTTFDKGSGSMGVHYVSSADCTVDCMMFLSVLKGETSSVPGTNVKL